MLRVAESSGVPALRECGISSRPALRKNFWSLERVQVLFKTRTMVFAHSWSFWSDVCLNWCLVEKLFRANTTSCVRSGVLPRVPVLEVCFEHTWFKLPHGIVKTRFRAYIHTYLDIYILTYLHTYLHTCMHANIHTYIPTYVRTYVHTYLDIYILTYLYIYIHTFMHANIHTYPPTYLPTLSM